jgi:hypothetical protein
MFCEAFGNVEYLQGNEGTKEKVKATQGTKKK